MTELGVPQDYSTWDTISVCVPEDECLVEYFCGDDLTAQRGGKVTDASTKTLTNRLSASAGKPKFERMPVSMQYRYLSSAPIDQRVQAYLSPIHGLGLFAVTDLCQGEPIVEYVGELIRDVIADKREKYYALTDKAKDASCYMFRLDKNFVVDATFMGNVARFINHSCEPNCICRVITLDDKSQHIIVFASKPIARGEEITYDYKFNAEEERNKIVCQCGAPSCLGRMN